MGPVVIAALFVAKGGCYFGLNGVDPWDEKRDARLYKGPHPVVAHPPCERWGRYWFGSPVGKVRHERGSDGGCFESALRSVRFHGGVIEHPEASYAWTKFRLNKPPKSGGWVPAGDFLGWTCCVEQGHYGHRARKATWLYVVGVVDLPELVWGPSAATAHIAQMSAARRSVRRSIPVEHLSHKERAATPLPFRDLLIGLARRASPPDNPYAAWGLL